MVNSCKTALKCWAFSNMRNTIHEPLEYLGDGFEMFFKRLSSAIGKLRNLHKGIIINLSGPQLHKGDELGGGADG